MNVARWLHPPAPVDSGDVLRDWRERILATILLVIMVLGALTAIPSIWLAISEGLTSVAWIDAIALGWVVTLWRLSRIPYRWRAWNLIALVYLLGIWFLFNIGLVSQIYLMAVPVLAALLLGLRAALLALALNTATLLLLAPLGQLSMPMTGLEQMHGLRWGVISMNFLFINAVLTISCAVLLNRLEQSLHEQHDIATSLLTGQAELKAANAELRLTGTALTRLNDMVVITEAAPLDEPGPRIVFVNEAFVRHTGYAREAVLGRSPRLLQGPQTSRSELDRIRLALTQRQAVHSELVNYTRSGQPFWVELDMVPVLDEMAQVSHWVCVQRDITERKKAQDDIHQLAYFDALTGLPNRRLLLDRLAQSIVSAQRAQQSVAVLFLDLDHFKNINDARGHAMGDRLLVQVGQRLSALAAAGDTVARLGGDEFVILSPLPVDCETPVQAALALASVVRVALEQPFALDGQTHTTSGSIGVTLLPRAGQSPEDVLREADTAMYRAKASGRNRIAFFEHAMQLAVEERLSLEHDLTLALQAGQLTLHLQSQVSPTGMLMGAEVLLRWQHPLRGAISPAVFIPIAEETSLILHLGRWVLEQAMRTQVQLQAAGHNIPLSINVSPSEFRQADFVQQVRDLLQATGADPRRLLLEVTEGLLIENIDSTVERMNALAELGIGFSIDDFGTGYSSLAYLKRLPLDELKIDKRFVQDMPGDASDTAIVEMILSMAKHLGLRVVAEGVETREQADFLAAHGCDAIQGYWYAHPIPVERWLQTQGRVSR